MNLIDRARNYLARRRTAYVKTFQGPFGEEVLADLAKFCRANQSAFHADPRAHALIEGRREVFYRIAKHLNLSDEQLWKLYGHADQKFDKEV